MRTDFQQFYVAPANVRDAIFYLTDDEAKHAVRVMRKQRGDRIEATDGEGRLYQGFIEHIDKNRITVVIENVLKNIGEPNLHLTLAHAIPKGNNFDIVIEKGTEIGVSTFQPILSERCIVEPSSRIERWQNKVQAASKQCGRSRFPDVLAPVSFSDFLVSKQYDHIFIAHQSSGSNNLNIVRECRTIAVLIGPEGGFTANEVKSALDAGCLPLQLGPRRLRSETAGLVAACKILSAAGELG